MLDLKFSSGLGLGRAGLGLGLVVCGLDYNTGSNTGSIRDDPYWTSRENSVKLIELSSVNKVSLV
jgi:hypothetical protein